MLIKITLFVTLVSYAFVISQSFFYVLAMSDATKKMQAPAYIETRQLIDGELQHSGYLMYYITLAACLALTAFSVVNSSGLLFISAVIALIALVVDMAVAVKGNIPLNKAIRRWTTTNYPNNWQQYRSRWFCFYHIRQGVNIVGFVTLLGGLVFGL
jgi:uncharacterized membrane protein